LIDPPKCWRTRGAAHGGPAQGTLSLLRADIRALPFRTSTRFDLVMAPYGILQSLVRESDLKATLASVARVLSARGVFALDLVPDLPAWRNTATRCAFEDAAAAGLAHHAGGIGSAGSTERRDDFRPAVHRAPRTASRHSGLLARVSHPVDFADDRTPRAGRVPRDRRAGDYDGRPWIRAPTCG